jgi:hypothetical protein
VVAQAVTTIGATANDVARTKREIALELSVTRAT